jgi:hypothetical protein
MKTNPFSAVFNMLTSEDITIPTLPTTTKLMSNELIGYPVGMGKLTPGFSGC